MKTFTKWIHTLVLTVLLVACENRKDQVFTPTTFTVEEAYEFLLDAGFMTDAPKGQRGYNPKALHKESAEDLLGTKNRPWYFILKWPELLYLMKKSENCL